VTRSVTCDLVLVSHYLTGAKWPTGPPFHIGRITITNDELAILCDIVAGRSVRQAENLDAHKRLVLDRLIANVQKANGQAIARYQTTAKTELLFSQLCIGISGGEDRQKTECRQL
jgi:hypothetical protein